MSTNSLCGFFFLPILGGLNSEGGSRLQVQIYRNGLRFQRIGEAEEAFLVEEHTSARRVRH